MGMATDKMVWEFFAGGAWRAMREEDTAALEEALAGSKKRVGIGDLHNGLHTYIVDLQRMQQTSLMGRRRHVRRVPASGGDASQSKCVYFMRHGQSEANATRHGSAILDPALTELGRTQAEAWRAETPRWGVEIVFVSPLLRTLETACLAFGPEASAAPLEVTRCAREHGWHEAQNRGTPYDQLRERMRALRLPEERLRGLGKLVRPHRFWDPVGEPGLTSDERKRRTFEAITHLSKKLEQAPGRVLACVCHYRVVLSICGLRLHNGEVAVCHFERDASGRWSLRYVDKREVPAPAPTPALELPSAAAAAASRGQEEAAPREAGVVIDESPRVAATLSGPLEVDSDNEDATAAAAASPGAGAAGDAGVSLGLGEFDLLASGSSEGEEEAPRASAGPPRSASVLIVGRSAVHGGVPVALLGGGMGKDTYRFCDFGGGLDGGPSRYGGRLHAKRERERPELGAFRELSEELLGLHGDEARQTADAAARAAELVGGQPVTHQRHLLFVCTAESLVGTLGRRGGGQDGVGSAIDRLVASFKPNSEVSSVALFSIDELLGAIECEDAAPVSPVWGWRGRDGKPHLFVGHDALACERLWSLPGCELLVRLPPRRDGSSRGPLAVSPHAMVLQDLESSRSMKLLRWERVYIRHSLRGPRGSVSALAGTLRAWAAAC